MNDKAVICQNDVQEYPFSVELRLFKSCPLGQTGATVWVWDVKKLKITHKTTGLQVVKGEIYSVDSNHDSQVWIGHSSSLYIKYISKKSYNLLNDKRKHSDVVKKAWWLGYNINPQNYSCYIKCMKTTLFQNSKNIFSSQCYGILDCLLYDKHCFSLTFEHFRLLKTAMFTFIWDSLKLLWNVFFSWETKVVNFM